MIYVVSISFTITGFLTKILRPRLELVVTHIFSPPLAKFLDLIRV